MHDVAKRVIGYGLSGIVGGVLVYGGFVYEADPDLMTMLGSVEVQLSQAATVTSDAEDGGAATESRAALLAAANHWLDRVDEDYPETAWSPWYRGYVAYLHSDYGEAACLYEQTRLRADCSDALRDRSIINQALMLRQVGQHGQAARLLRRHQHQFLDEHADTVREQLAAIADVADSASATVPATPESTSAK